MNHSPPPARTRAEIRRRTRLMRRQMSEPERFRRSHALCQNLARCGLLLRHRRFTAFYPNDGEVDLSPLFPRLWQQGKQLYLPVIRDSRLWFMAYGPGTPLALNRFGIPEPRVNASKRAPLMSLDVVLMPLVAFDAAGNRIGMGGGYYDRTFAHKRFRPLARKPLLVGVAFEFQRFDALPEQPWDVPLDGAITDAGVSWFGSNRHRATSPRCCHRHD